MVAGLGEGNDNVAELVGCLGEAVDEKNDAFWFVRRGETFDVEDPDFGAGLLEPDLAVVGFGWGLRGHCLSFEGRCELWK